MNRYGDLASARQFFHRQALGKPRTNFQESRKMGSTLSMFM